MYGDSNARGQKNGKAVHRQAWKRYTEKSELYPEKTGWADGNRDKDPGIRRRKFITTGGSVVKENLFQKISERLFDAVMACVSLFIGIFLPLAVMTILAHALVWLEMCVNGAR